MLNKEIYKFLSELKKNNTREWFDTHKNEFKNHEKEVKDLYQSIFSKLQKHDHLNNVKVYRIYRDVRFSLDKTPYKTHFGGVFSRVKPDYRGGYYLHLEQGNTFVGGGFWEPTKEDLHRIRKEFEADDTEIRAVLSDPVFKKTYGSFEGESVKTAPKGFDKNHPAIDLIRLKQLVVFHKFSDDDVFSEDFADEVVGHFLTLRPFFDYMSEVLTTNLNGESV
ncbi:MAG: TIGR02453 family protein [Bacteroidetes bacterium HGW-Bacteroidetes-13]|nr:MAG: TIGR02453 family protein [Bacteroidetes bacterium HGW-Bacteroidetes-13]